jgi:1-acyl-sn-glycerol-3-phosphate acyltransferase
MTKLNPFFLVSARIFQVTAWPGTRFLLWFFGRLEVKGLENLNQLPKGKAVIFASNHSAEIDPFIPPASLPFMSRFVPLYYTIREKSFYDESGFMQIFYGGFFFKFIGGQYVYAGLKDYEKSLPNFIELLRQNRNLFIFPEGGINRKGTGPGEAKGGIAYLAEKMNSPIVPIGISGMYGMSFAAFFARKRKIRVTFGAPIFQNEIKSVIARGPADDVGIYKKEAQYVMDKIAAMIQ